MEFNAKSVSDLPELKKTSGLKAPSQQVT